MTEQPTTEVELASLVARYVVRARRRADLSQRELAQLVGVSQSTICRVEAGEGQVGASTFVRILTMAGLTLTVTDASGATVAPVSADTVRDNAGRRFPAHLDVGPPDVPTQEQLNSPRYDRQQPRASYHLRARRDRIRSLSPDAKREALAIGRPDPTTDHPTTAGLQQRRRLIRGRQLRVDPGPVPPVECDCLLECYEVGPCVGPCPCQCEALAWQRPWSDSPRAG
ncbi:MAG: helix-turn-helix transcriptional regulator [Terracoccus sp.]